MIDPTELANILAEAIQIKYEKEETPETPRVKDERHCLLLNKRKTEIEILFPSIFYELRNLSGVSPSDFAEEWGRLFREEDLHERPKSKSVFMLSKTKKYIMKTISTEEARNLRHMLLPYLAYCKENPHTFLNRYLLLVKIHKKSTPYKGYVIVTKNIFSEARDIRQVYDLKGRLPKSGKHTPLPSWKVIPYRSRVIEDKNLIRRFHLIREERAKVVAQLHADFEFLCSQNLMDYSLLIGVTKVRSDNPPKSSSQDPAHSRPSSISEERYFIGVIDTLTTYTLKKKISHFLKSLLWRKETLSTIPPAEYCDRISRYSESIFSS